MADNRGNSSKTNSSLPNSRPNGVTRPSDKNSYDTYKSIDTKTIKEMQTVYSGLTKFALELGVNLKDFNNAIEKSADTIVSTRQKLDKTAKEYDAEVAEMKKHYFGANKKIAENYEKFIDEKKKLLEEEFEETRKEERKNIIKQSFKMEKEKNSVKLLDSKYIEHNFKDLINNEYQSELEKLNISALEMFGESFKENSQYQKALSELGKEYTNKVIKESFKDESKRNEIKFMDNKFSKGNNLANVSNEYYSQLEKLKSDALDTFEDGLDNKEYKKALMNLNNKYAQDMKDAWKEDFKENHKVLGGIANGIKDTFDRNKETLQGLLGPLNLFIAPLKDFFGGFGAVFKFIGGGVKKLFGKFTKKNPTASDVLKSGAFGVGALYIGSKLEQMFGKTKGENKKGIFDKLKNNILSKLLPFLGLTAGATKKDILKKGGKKLLGGASKFLKMGHGGVASGLGILASGALMAKDAMKGVQMAGQGEWSESKIASGMGGLLGGFDSGFKGAFKNMGKWALMGFGIGNIICPIVGGLIGGLIGSAVGGILGWIGGAKISKAMEKLGKWGREKFDKAKEGLKNAWSKATEIWGEGKEAFKNGTFFTNFVPDLLNRIKDKLFEGWNMLKESPLGQFVQKLFENIQNGMTKFFDENPIGKWMDSYIIAPIKNAFGQMGAWFSYIGDAFEKDGMTGALHAMTVGSIKKDKSTGLTEFETYKQNLLNPTTVDDAIIRTDGSIIKTNPKDTLVALKDVPLSMEQVRNNTTKNLNTSLSNLGNDKTLEKKLTTIIDVLSKILAKDVQVNLPPQTRSDLDILMSGGMI